MTTIDFFGPNGTGDFDEGGTLYKKTTNRHALRRIEGE